MSYRGEKYRLWLEDAHRCRNDIENLIRKGVLTRIHDGDTWKERHIKKANHNLDFASTIAELHDSTLKERFPKQSFYDWVTVAYYYAVYHAALALISNAALKSKSHMATLCGIINYYYHQDKVLEKRHVETLGRIEKSNIEQFIESQSLRERASYGASTSFEERLAVMARKDAVEFVNRVKEILA